MVSPAVPAVGWKASESADAETTKNKHKYVELKVYADQWWSIFLRSRQCELYYCSLHIDLQQSVGEKQVITDGDIN